jgi:apolipoprotein N-acyltransferase
LLLRARQQAAGLTPPPPLLLPEGTLPLDDRPAGEPAVPLLGGGFRRQDGGERSSVLWLPAGADRPRAWVDKHRLVPLGEWVPLADRIPWEGLSAVGGLQPGPADRRLPLPLPAGDAAVAICYELADGRALARAVADGAGWLLAVANLDPYPPLLQFQFLNLARLRSIETGRWLVSVANTGPTAVVDPAGRVVQQLPTGGPRLGLLELRGRRSLSVYDRWGDGPLLLLSAGAAALAARQAR